MRQSQHVSQLQSYNALVRNLLVILLLSVLVLGTAFGQAKPGLDKQGVYQNQEIGFSFTPPSGLTDVTAKANGSAKPDPNSIALLLFELSGPNSNDLQWRGLAVQSYTRAQVSMPDDFDVESRMSRTITGKDWTETAAPTKVTIGDNTFAFSQFQHNRGLLKQYSHVYTTIIHGQLVAFAFTANSTAQLDDMKAALKTLTVMPSASGK